MEDPEKNSEEEEEKPKPSLFPLFPTTITTSTTSPSHSSQWLCNTSFTADLSSINEAVSAAYKRHDDNDEDEENDNVPRPSPSASPSYELLEEEEEEQESDRERSRRRRRKKKEKKNRKRSKERGGDFNSYVSSKSKDYYFDSHGDRDNLVYGRIYRMDVPRYKLPNPEKLSGFGSRGFYRSKRGLALDGDVDVDEMDGKVKSVGRYWSAKYAALERNKNLKRIRITADKKSAVSVAGDFIPLVEIETSHEGSVSYSSVLEESWEDEVLRKTREFNKLTREHPYDEKGWLDFADFQDVVASKQPQKGARMQILEKKVSILEKAVELNPDNEELLLSLMKAYQSRDNTDVLISRWEKVLMQHPGNCKLWREFLNVVQGEFSRFKVSDMRKMYGHAIQALSAARIKQFRLTKLLNLLPQILLLFN